METAKMPEKPLKRSDVVYRPLEEEGLLVDTKNKKVHSLNRAANFIWGLCDGCHSLQDISKELAARFDVKEPDAMKDTERMVAEFQTHHLLQN